MTRIFLDGFALRFPRTGIVNYVYNVAARLNDHPRLDLTLLLKDLDFADQEIAGFAKSVDHRLVCDGLNEKLQRKALPPLWSNPQMPLPLPDTITKITDACDVYHATDLYFHPSRKAAKNIITVYDLTAELFPEYHEPLNILKERLKGQNLASFDHVIAISESTRRDIIEHLNIPEKQVTVLPCGVDSVYERHDFLNRSDLCERINIPDDRRYILSVSTIEPRKNIIGVLESFRVFCTRNPSIKDVVLVLCGPMGWANQSLAAYLESYPFADRVIFPGYVSLDIMPSLYYHAEAFMYLSFYEGFGIPILEAMKSACPVICADNSSLAEVIGECGIRVSAHSPKAACEALEVMLRDHRFADECRKNGLLRAKGMTWERHVEGLLAIYGVSGAASTAKTSAALVHPVTTADQRYRDWVLRREKLEKEELGEIKRHIEVMIERPRFVIYIEGEDNSERSATLASLQKQIYVNFTAVHRKSAVVEAAHDGLFIYLRAGDLLHWRALYECAAAFNSDPTLDFISFDEDVMKEDGTRSEPYFKPDWSPDLLEATNYIGSAACYDLAKAQGILASSAGLYDFVLRFSEKSSQRTHIRRVLMHLPRGSDALISQEQRDQDMGALDARLSRTQRKGRIVQLAAGYACYRAELVRSLSPLVSIVIPTAGRVVEFDGVPRDLIVECVGAIDRLSTYGHYEFVIIDNGDFDRGRLDHVYEHPIRYVHFEDEAFNLSKKLAMGAAKAAGSFLLLMNDDIEVITPNWIERMLDHFAKPHVGLVGAKLMYPDMRIQHAGVVSSKGHFKHVNGHLKREDRGSFFSNIAARNYLGVTGAVTMTRANLFCQLGGYDEAMPIWANDLDYALKVREAGYTVVYDPSIELIHFEKGSLEANSNASHEEILYKRWGHIVKDPYYNAHMMYGDTPIYEFSPNSLNV